MSISDLGRELLENKGNVDKYNFNNVIRLLNKNEDHQETFANSDYYDIDSMLESFNRDKCNFSTLTLNIDGINTKFNELLAFITLLQDQNFHFSAILLQETMLSDMDCESNNVNIFEIPNYNMISQGRKCGRKGGLIIYLHDDYKATPKNLYNISQHWEGLFIDVTSPLIPGKIILGNIYRPPRDNYSNASIDRFLDPFNTIIETLQKDNSTLIIGGDFNINLLQLNEREKFQEYYDLLVTRSLYPHITLPTRFSKNNATLIDQIFCRFSKNETHNTSGILLKKISDHLPCFSTINIHTKKKQPPKYIKIRESGEKAMEAFRTEIKTSIENSNFDMDSLSDPNINYSKLESIITSASKNCFPEKEVKFNKYKHKISPWVTKGILNLIKFRDNLYVKWKKSNPSSILYHQLENSFKSFCSILQKTMRNAKSQYYYEKFNNYQSDIKNTWKQINEIIHKKKKIPDLPKYFLDNDKILTENTDIANCFNNFFSQIGPKLAKSIKSPPNKSYKDYLTQNITSTFSFQTVTQDNTLKVINNLKPKSSTGHDGISTILLKFIAHDILHILTGIINQSLSTGIFPDSLKIAKITPIFKKENPHIADNYRPISLLPSISKVFEKIVYIQVYDYFVDNNLLYKSQYGFRQYHSTEYAALEITDKISTQLDQGKLPLAIYLDLSKAFDTIDHSILLNKLSYYGIKGHSLNWFQSYLSNRKQYVEYNNTLSSFADVTTGVPQGSILGPLLFIIYMNDIAHITQKFHSILYADDTSLIEPLCTFSAEIQNNRTVLSETINKELNLITDWLALNKLSLNAKKNQNDDFSSSAKKYFDLDSKIIHKWLPN